MGIEDVIHGHVPFGVAIGLLVVVLGFFLYLTIKMFRKSKAKKYRVLFLIATIAVLALIVVTSAFHFSS